MAIADFEKTLGQKGLKLPLTVIIETDQDKRQHTIHLLLNRVRVGYKHSEALFYELLNQSMEMKVNSEFSYNPVIPYINVTLEEGDLVMMPGASQNPGGSIINYEQLCRLLGPAPDPTCGHCGNPVSCHYIEEEIYCFENTTSDTFTDKPREEFVASMIREKYPQVYEQYVAEWKHDNGHG